MKPRYRQTLAGWENVDARERLSRGQSATVDAADDDATDVEAPPARPYLPSRDRGMQWASRGRQVPPVAVYGDGVQTRYVGTQPNRALFGFSTASEYFATARRAMSDRGPQQQAAAERMMNAATTYGSEGIGADGGFAVPPEIRGEILAKVTGEDSLLGRCDQLTIASNTLVVPKDESPPWGTTGVQAYWSPEGGAIPQSKPVLEQSTIATHKLASLVPLTDELVQDSRALGDYVTRKAGDALNFKITDAIVNGSGAGMPLGIMNSGCLVTQAAELSQTAATIHGLNLIKMWARMPAQWRGGASWLIHPDVEPALMGAALEFRAASGGAASGAALVFQPADGISGARYPTLFGRPVIPLQSCAALGTSGDIIFAALSQYAALTVRPGLRADVSIHLFFDYDTTAFRFVVRIGGQPWWSSPLTAKNGSTTYSPFVALAAR